MGELFRGDVMAGSKVKKVSGKGHVELPIVTERALILVYNILNVRGVFQSLYQRSTIIDESQFG